MDNNNVNTALLERLEKIVESLQENSVKMGELLAVHNEKLDKQDQIDGILFQKLESLHKDLTRETELIKQGCERDIRKVDERLRTMEKKMWSIFGALSVISFLVSPVGQRIIRPVFQPTQPRLTPVGDRATMLEPTQDSYGDRRRVRSTTVA